jgi:ketosteroid isomerase-like protein
MRTITTGIFLTLTLSALTLTAATPNEAVLDAVHNYRQALVKKDLKALEGIWSDDYVFVNSRGEIRTKADRLAELKSGATALTSITHEDEPTVTKHGDATLVLSRVTIVGKYNGHEVSGQFRSLHVWSHIGGQWRLVYNQLTPIVK